MTAEVNIPNAAFMAAAEVSAVDDDTIDSVLAAGAPEIIAADYEQFAAELRGTLHNLPEYAHGSLAWTVMNAIDAHIAELRGESR